MPYSDAGKAKMLQGLIDDADKVSLHDGDPGGSGTANEISGGGYARGTIAEADWTGPSAGSAALTSAEAFSGTAAQSVTHFGLWDDTVFLGSAAVTGDAAFNAAGEYNLSVTVEINDPA